MPIGAILQTWRWNKRRLEVRRRVVSEIEGEGGAIDEVGIIGLLLRSPFRPLSRNPIYLKIGCRYPEDWGEWYVCASGADDLQWVWKSATGKDTAPIERAYEVKVDNTTYALPAWFSAALWALLMAAVISLPFWPVW